MNPAVECVTRLETPQAWTYLRAAPPDSRAQRDHLKRRAEDELARMEYERLVAVGLDELGEIVLLPGRVDVGA